MDKSIEVSCWQVRPNSRSRNVCWMHRICFNLNLPPTAIDKRVHFTAVCKECLETGEIIWHSPNNGRKQFYTLRKTQAQRENVETLDDARRRLIKYSKAGIINEEIDNSS